jgi:heterodisulfide reductase subunit A
MEKDDSRMIVVGAGISGIRCAMDLAETGHQVTLIDEAPAIGGLVARMDHQFPDTHCGMCRMLPLSDRDAGSQFCLRKGFFHDRIEVLTHTTMVGVEGEAGNFRIRLRHTPSLVNQNQCIGCGFCRDVCPVSVPDAFNGGLSLRKAIYQPSPHAVPGPFFIDLAACTRCGQCVNVCPTGAIHLKDEKRGQFRILVVDDELIIRDSLSEWLREEGFDVSMAASGAEALDLLSVGTVDLMLTDIKMPGMDGVELLKRAREAVPDLCVLMMTAYATVETAIAALKTGARDYLIKPFEPDTVIPKIVEIYEARQVDQAPVITGSAIVLCCGTSLVDPFHGKNLYGYGVFPNVLTSFELERMESGTGPTGGALIRPHDGKPVRKIAWLLCVGSRDLQSNADFCSSVCCMHAIKEAMLARDRMAENSETIIYYTDLRTPGKFGQRYRDAATVRGVKFERGRIHSVSFDSCHGDLVIQSLGPDGKAREKRFDLLVLAVGQRPARDMGNIAQMMGLALNPNGFIPAQGFSLTRSERAGIFLGGSVAGPKDISDSVIQASAAALDASLAVNESGFPLFAENADETRRDVSREEPAVFISLCRCFDKLADRAGPEALAPLLAGDRNVVRAQVFDSLCKESGWKALAECVGKIRPNRLLITACRPDLFREKLRSLSYGTGLDPCLMAAVDMGMAQIGTHLDEILAKIRMAAARLRSMDPTRPRRIPVTQRALVVGGGIAGMTAALSIARHGIGVDIVETEAGLGGNLNWLHLSIDGQDIQRLLDETRRSVEQHPLITVHARSRVISSFGQVGDFHTIIEKEAHPPLTLTHGVTILATGGAEARTNLYRYGQHPAILTQKELEMRMGRNEIHPETLSSVVMIHCVGSREEPRNFCSRICCTGTLKHALHLKEKNPNVVIYVFYRDMMTCGFEETYFTQARKTGILFIRYTPDEKPEILPDVDENGLLQVRAVEPIINREIVIAADLVVLATGMAPNPLMDLAGIFGFETDADGFFREADHKWRPVDALKDGVYACGMALSPRNIIESIASAQAAAQRSLRVLISKELKAGQTIAYVRHSLCTVCGRCIDVCPYGARIIDIEEDQVMVNPVMCQGCGACAAACPNFAAELNGYASRQMFDIIDAAIQS